VIDSSTGSDPYYLAMIAAARAVNPPAPALADPFASPPDPSTWHCDLIYRRQP
jgi:hypothetical protein